ncbi:GGDEF domain-containing protein [Micromonospora sp. DT4]|uniref:GGDEF domain-containing protein n=1 Tax=Micromonospora sp. DT4 TaxID=3393438 RepID=UPI003CE86C48
MSTPFFDVASAFAGMSVGLTIATVLLAYQRCQLRAARRLLDDAYRQLHVAEHQARHDLLTGLSNRRGCFARLRLLLQAGGPVSVAVLDLDGFKAVNDNLDHAAGDRQLTDIAASLTTLPVDLVARLGGDEFALLIRGGPEVAHLVAELARLAVARTVTVPRRGVVLELTANVGVALARPGDTARSLLHRADQAERHAKRNGLGIYHQ